MVLSDKETKQRKRFNRTTLSVHSVQFLFIGAPKARCSPERRMFETLLLANPDIDTLRHRCSRASTSCQETCSASRIFAASFPGWLAVVRYAYKFGDRFSADNAGRSFGQVQSLVLARERTGRSVLLSGFARRRGSHIRGSGEHRAFGVPMNRNCTLWTLNF